MTNQTDSSDAKKPLVSLIIAVYNHADFLTKIFLSLKNQTLRDFEIVVSDDGSGTEIAEVVKRFSPDFLWPIKHIWHEDNGFRKTVIANKAVTAASADYLVFIDGDCILHHSFLERHYRHRKQNAVLGGRRVMLNKEFCELLTEKDVAFQKIESPAFFWKHCAKEDRKHGFYIPLLMYIENLLKKTYSFYGSNFSLYKTDYCAVNGYDERIIGRGVEDDNLRERLKLNGNKIRSITREAIQYHLFHSFAPVPHSKETIQEFCFPKQAWTPNGIIKNQQE